MGSEIDFIILVLVIAFFAVTHFFRGNVELTFSFRLVLRLSLHAVSYVKNEERDQWTCSSMPDLLIMCLCLEDPQDLKKGQPSNT